jgi:hypothetical protein
MTLECRYLPEPLLEFANGQKVETPKDGLFLFGPVEALKGRTALRIGAIGTASGLTLLRHWLGEIAVRIPGKAGTLWAPDWPGFEPVFNAALPAAPMAELSIDAATLERAIKKSNRADAVRSAVKLFEDAIRDYLRQEERRPDVWVVVVPDVVFKYGRPKVAMPPKAEQTPSTLLSESAARKFYQGGDLFPSTVEADAETYKFSSNFHHQLKAQLLSKEIAIQIALESTLQPPLPDETNAGRNRKGLQDRATIAWNFGTTLYFKADARPWQLASVRPGVCYVGLVFKADETPGAKGEACCAAQMFLNSGDGLVFRGALGPWYSEKLREYHLSRDAAANLMKSVVEGYKAKHNQLPQQLFIHGRHRFSKEEWAGFVETVPPETHLVGVRIRSSDDMRLFRPRGGMPVLRGAAVALNERNGLLWTQGFVPRLASYQGFETPKPLSVELTHGRGDLWEVMADVLALTKVNYNACDYASGLPVTLKFADKVGEILMAAPALAESPPLPFRYYI